MAKISEQEIRDLAKLARIGLDKDEERSLAKEMTAILDYVKKLEAVDTRKVKPTAQVTGLTNVLADDKIIESTMSKEDLLANAPATEDGFIKVRKVLD